MQNESVIESLFLEVCGEYLEAQDGFSVRGELGVFSTAMVTWLGIQARLGKQSLNDALSSMVERIRAGDIRSLVSRPSRKLRERGISLNSGGLSRARGRVAESVVRELFSQGTSKIEASLASRREEPSSDIYLIDGLIVSAARTGATVERYGTVKNRNETLHYPRVRVVSAHRLDSGICAALAIGSYTEHETVLGSRLLGQLPKGALVVMDRGFASPAFIKAAEQLGLSVLVRLKDSMGKKLLSGSKDEASINWKTARTKDKPLIEISGRVIHFTANTPGFRSDEFYLFTNADLAVSALADLYRKRVQIESAIRHIKQTLDLFFISAKTPEAIQKEIYIAFLTFNLLRAIMEDAALSRDISVTRISFTATINLCRAYSGILLKARKQDVSAILEEFRTHLLQVKLPQRKSPRSYPREVKMSRDKYPSAAASHSVKTEIGK